MVRTRDLGYSVAGVLISFVHPILGDSTPGGDEMNAGETYSSRYARYTSNVFVQGNKFQDSPMRGTFALTHGMVVRITNPRDLARPVIAVKGKDHTASCYV